MIESRSTSFSAIAVSGYGLTCTVGSKGGPRAGRGRRVARRSVNGVPSALLVSRVGLDWRSAVVCDAAGATPLAQACRIEEPHGAHEHVDARRQERDVPLVSMIRTRRLAGRRRSSLAGVWLEAPQRCLAALLR
jgi:hypothetical protein